ncbi:hypothetical protein Ct61P_14112 [Colletotrichum tofieldiae]|nr:hypothetical protein Ct61P_14112 [Colletotrichum tofieldiae]
MLGSTPWAHGHCSPPSNKAKRHPEALHTRKPSLSNSVSSSDSSSTQSTRSTGTVRHSRVLDFDPLSLHPTFHPPPRLYERPFIHSSQSLEDDVISSYFSSQEAAAAEQAKASFAAAVPGMPAPPMKSLDSVEDFIKRGGWKRRGIVFEQEGSRSSNTLF